MLRQVHSNLCFMVPIAILYPSGKRDTSVMVEIASCQVDVTDLAALALEATSSTSCDDKVGF